MSRKWYVIVDDVICKDFQTEPEARDFIDKTSAMKKKYGIPKTLTLAVEVKIDDVF